MAEWVRALDWRPGGPGWISHSQRRTTLKQSSLSASQYLKEGKGVGYIPAVVSSGIL